MKGAILCLLALVLALATAAPAVPVAPAAHAESAAPLAHKERRTLSPNNIKPGMCGWTSCLGANDLVIYLQWTTSQIYGGDLDLIVKTSSTCHLAAKANDNTCANNAPGVDDDGYLYYNDNNFKSYICANPPSCASGSDTWFGYNLDTFTTEATDTSASSTPTFSRGYEMVYLPQVQVGIYPILVYNADPSPSVTGYVYITNALVSIWHLNTGNGIAQYGLYDGSDITSASGRNACYGRFWNAGYINVTGTSPLAFHYQATDSITTTPSVSLGTTATQDFEGTNNRPTGGC